MNIRRCFEDVGCMAERHQPVKGLDLRVF